MPYSSELDFRITDTSLRDGSHAKQHRFTPEHVRQITTALDAAGIPVIEVSHGDGLGGSSFTYGFSATDERTLIREAAEVATRAKIAVLVLPGVGVRDDIAAAADCGASICRVATHCTEADVSRQHFSIAREMGFETVGFLMMAHTVGPEVLAVQARIMVDAGCQCVYVVDSAGAMVLDQVSDRVAALVAEIGDDAQVGFHGHENLGLAVGNSLLAVRAGAVQIDGSTRRFGAGAGNTPLEAFVAAAEKLELKTDVDTLALIDAAEDAVRPVMDGECVLDRLAVVMGYAGVYSSFLKHAYRVAERYGVPGSEILLEAGRRKLVGGQEDQLIDVALELVRRNETAGLSA
jgi:4-hydroxy 2-oxovalerate aldolase